MTRIPEDVRRAREQSELICDAAEVQQALDRMAEAITARLAGTNPLVLCVLTGGLMPAGWLLQRLDFPLQLDYLHATRYRGATRGESQLQWLSRPRFELRGRHVLLVDDILDEGLTLAGVVTWCKAQGAHEVLTAVLTEKQHDRNTTGLKADFVGLRIPDRYVFGCGLDYKHYWRNLPAIYALRKL